jgi:hypothetical protein
MSPHVNSLVKREEGLGRRGKEARDEGSRKQNSRK